VTNSCDVSAAQTDNSRPSFNIHHVTFRSSASRYKSAANVILAWTLTKRSIAHWTVYGVTIKGFYPHYMHASSSATISRWILSIILVFASRGSDMNCRNSAIVLNGLFLYWWVNRLLSRLILTLFIYTHKKYSGGWASTLLHHESSIHVRICRQICILCQYPDLSGLFIVLIVMMYWTIVLPFIRWLT